MSPLDTIALLLGLAAAFGLVNYHWLRLPATIGLVLIALAASLAVMALDALFPGLTIADDVRRLVAGIDFYATVMDGMLSFLLFAGALHVDFHDLASRKWTIGILASVGVLISTAVVGLGMHWIAGLPLAAALVFGALISPTDPVAVLGILKTVRVPKSLEVKIAGESLFNDGVGVVVFLILTAIAFPSAGGDGGAAPVGLLGALELFAVEALGGAALGAATGWIAYRLIRGVDEYTLEVIVTLALVVLTYAVAGRLHVSGPIAVVVAGLFIGNKGVRYGMSEETRAHLLPFWHLIDEILNAVLFLLIGMEVFAVAFAADHALAVALAIPLVLLARFVAVSLPIRLLAVGRTFTPGVIPVMTWGGLRGGISVALALSLPAGEAKALILPATYAVVVFSIVVQGLTVKRAVRRFVREDPAAAEG
ncbi:cation:proton antiporter [Azospirillum sp. A39]|uniref:cation:proton antiporter n=1 Tax=Azospirillum sp. A39 TaxID=3462279 RepID=UPI0040453FE5